MKRQLFRMIQVVKTMTILHPVLMDKRIISVFMEENVFLSWKTISTIATAPTQKMEMELCTWESGVTCPPRSIAMTNMHGFVSMVGHAATVTKRRHAIVQTTLWETTVSIARET
jgi:hypothetical protein